MIGVQGMQVIVGFSTLLVGGLVISVTAFLVGFCCGWWWRLHRGGPTGTLWRGK